MKEDLTIVLLTHNRPKQAMEAVASILSQINQKFFFLVSDNSNTNELEVLLENSFQKHQNYPKLKYRKTEKVYSAFDHVNKCIDEIKTKYFCLFHDDDIMLDVFVQEFWIAQGKFPDAVAFGGNAFSEKSGITGRIFFEAHEKYVGPISSLSLMKRYFSRNQLGFAPFPSYVYNKLILGNYRGVSNDGKYGDVKWLADIASLGSLYWINKPLMIYRLHDQSDSSTESRKDRLKFLGYLKKHLHVYGRWLVSDYRFFLYKKICQSQIMTSDHNYNELLNRYLSSYRLFRWFRVDHWIQLLTKVFVRCINKIS